MQLAVSMSIILCYRYLLRSWDASAKQLHRLPFAGSSSLEESFLLEFLKSEGKDGSTNTPIWIIGTAALESASVRSKLRRIRRSLRRVRKVPQTGSMSHELMNTFLEADVGTLSSTAELPLKPTGSGTEGELSEAPMPSNVTADLATGNRDLAGECSTAARVSDEREQIKSAAPIDRNPSKAAAQSSPAVQEISPKPSPHQHSKPMQKSAEQPRKVQSNCNDRSRVSEELHENRHMPISNSTASSSSSRIMVSVFEEGQQSQGSESTEPKASSNHSALSVDAILRRRLSPLNSKKSSQQIISSQPDQSSPQKQHPSQGAKFCQSNPSEDNRAACKVDAQAKSDSKVIPGGTCVKKDDQRPGGSSQQSGSVDGKKNEPGTALKKPTKSLEEILQKRLSQGKRSGCSADLTLTSEPLPKDQLLDTRDSLMDTPSKTVESVLQKYSAAHIARSQ